MPEPLRPAKSSLYGRENWIFVPTLASPAAPTVAEVTATSALDLTNIAFASSTWPTQSTNQVEAERRFGDTVTFQAVGTTTVAGGEMLYAFDPQALAGSDGKKAWEKFKDGAVGYLVQRMKVDKAVAVTAGQFVNVFPVEYGPSLPARSGDGESAESAATTTYVVTGPIQRGVAVA